MISRSHPHRAPPLSDDGQDVVVPTCRRRQAVKVLARSGAVSGASATMTSFPLGDPFPPQTPPPVFLASCALHLVPKPELGNESQIGRTRAPS